MTAVKLPPTPGPRCGEPAGHRAHRKRGERSCEPCRRAGQDAENKRRRERRAGIGPAPRERWDYAPKITAAQRFILEVENLVDSGEGWGRICEAFDTTPANLDARLIHNKRPDLSAAIFGTLRHELTQGKAA